MRFLTLPFLSWLFFLQIWTLSLAQDAAQQPLVDLGTTGRQVPEGYDAGSGAAQEHAYIGGDKEVQDAIRILERIQTPSLNLERLSKRKGFVGTTVKYAQEIFTLLFLNAPSGSEFTTKTSSSAGQKLNSDLTKAVNQLRSIAEQHSNPDALWLLGEMNFHGNFTHPRNYTAAFQYYHQLADLNGNASAQHMVGFIYATGIGGAVVKDQGRALLYHTFAAQQGHIRSQMTVAYRHHAGIGTPRSCEKAVGYYAQVARKAVDYYKSGPPGGHVLIKNSYRIADETGGPYGEGASVSSAGPNARVGGPGSDAYADIADVLEYLDFQSRKGDLRASYNLAKLYYDGSRGLERDMAQAKGLFMQIARMYWRANGDVIADVSGSVKKLAPRAAGHLGRMFLRGEGTKQNFDKAMIWFKRGIEYGDVLSQYSVGVMYMYGLGVPKDSIRASTYLSAAADSEMAVAQTDLGVLFLDQGDVNTARVYFESSIRSGHIEAFYYLAEMANQGLARERSCGLAAAYYKIAAEKAEVIHSSFIEANEAYDAGDIQKALVGYMMAAEQGYENAQANVAWLLDQTRALHSIPAILARFLPFTFIRPQPISSADASLSLIYYTRSARQQNLDSLLKAGDHHLLGLGIPSNTTSPSTVPPSSSSQSHSQKPPPSPPALLNPSPKNAATCYQAASESMRSAQAMWNLGWMHEIGLGVEKDYHLAKRYYDLALETNKEAYLPVKLSLFKLRVRSWWNEVSGGEVRGIGPEENVERKLGFWEFVGRFLENDEHGGAREVGWDDDEVMEAVGVDGEEWEQRAADGEGEAPGEVEYLVNGEIEDGLWESLAIVALAGILAGLIWWRQQRVQAANALRGQGQEQVFPAPDDPDFAPWNVPGGIGH